jgi:NIMA (never in mitosis gene a)-related kinase
MILHRDLKPGNIFFDAEMNVKIGDFGLSKIMGPDSMYAHTHVGTPYYMSPEQINNARYNEKSDIWSLGCLIYELTALHPPFQAKNDLALAMKIRAGQFERIPEQYSPELTRVIAWMLKVDSTKRPGVVELLNVPRISHRIRDRRLKEETKSVNAKEAELSALEIEL